MDAIDFPTTSAVWHQPGPGPVVRQTATEAGTLWIIEGVDSYRAIWNGTVTAHGFPVTEGARSDTKQHRVAGKSATLDAHCSSYYTLVNVQIASSPAQ